MKMIIITVFVYSFVATLANIYKDYSSYSHGMEWTDAIIGGPVTWILLVSCFICLKPISEISKRLAFKPKKVKLYSEKQIKRIVAKVVRNARKSETRKKVYYNLTKSHNGYYNQYCGWRTLLVDKEINQFINRKFSRYMGNQTGETLNILKEYFIPVTEEIMRKDNYDEYYIERYKDSGFVKLK